MRRAGKRHVFSFGNEFVDMVFSPLAEKVKDTGQGETIFTQGVFYMGRDFLVDFSCNDLIFLQFPELLDKHFLADRGNQFLEFTGAQISMTQIAEDDGFPFAADDIHGGFDADIVNFLHFFSSKGDTY